MKSIWQESCNMPSFPSFKGNKKTDVLIIGGGIAGILCAYFLSQSGVDCILLEKDRICAHTTANTTAKITTQHGLIYDKIRKRYGAEMARMYFEANSLALHKFEKMCADIDCDFKRQNNFVYSTDDRKALENEMRTLERIGVKAKLYESMPLPIKTVGGICFEHQAKFNPLKFISTISKNLNIYENTLVRHVDGKRAIGDFGAIEAEKIIIATHFPFIDRHGLYFLKLYQHRSYVIALENAAELDGMYVDEDKKGLSFRSYNGLLLLGGGSHRTGKKGGSYGELRDFAKLNYPRSQEVCHWATQDCMSLDGIAYIGRYSRATPDMYVASGFNKWGMTSSMLSAIILSDMISGKANDYAKVFDPSRSILHPQLILNTFETTKNLLTPTTPRCAHLGCALKWNASEHSWDCSCHGSRFERSGEPIDNPANKKANIKK